MYYVQEGTIYRELEGLQLSLRELYIVVVIDCSVWHWEDNDDKFSINQRSFVLREKVQNWEYLRDPFSDYPNL